jgi:hypothetical protein
MRHSSINIESYPPSDLVKCLSVIYQQSTAVFLITYKLYHFICALVKLIILSVTFFFVYRKRGNCFFYCSIFILRINDMNYLNICIKHNACHVIIQIIWLHAHLTRDGKRTMLTGKEKCRWRQFLMFKIPLRRRREKNISLYILSKKYICINILSLFLSFFFFFLLYI